MIKFAYFFLTSNPSAIEVSSLLFTLSCLKTKIFKLWYLSTVSFLLLLWQDYHMLKCLNNTAFFHI